jgi:hypothetical protein
VRSENCADAKAEYTSEGSISGSPRGNAQVGDKPRRLRATQGFAMVIEAVVMEAQR